MSRTIKQSLDNARRIAAEITTLASPTIEDVDMVNMITHIEQLNSIIVDSHAHIKSIKSNSTSFESYIKDARTEFGI